MNFSAWSIRNPVPALLLFVLLTIFGILGLKGLGIQQFPDMDVPTIKVSATLEGAAPAQLETEVARKIEDKLASLSKIEHISTTITDGSVSIAVSFEIDKNTESALNEVRNAVDSAKADLPSSMNTPTVSKVTMADSALLTYTVASAKLDETELSWFIDNDVAKAMLSARGVAQVSRIGGVDREVHINLDPALMAGLGVTAGDVSTQLKAVQKDSSGGRGEVGGAVQSVRTLGAVGTAADVAALTIPLADGLSVRLAQIAKVTDSFAERSTLAFLDGKAVMGFKINRSKGFSDVAVAEAVRAAMPAFQAAHPQVKIHRDQQYGHPDHRELRRFDAPARRGRDPRGAGGLVVPARLAGDRDLGDGLASVHPSGLCGDVSRGVLAEPDIAAGPGPGGRHPRRRCDRRSREHRPATSGWERSPFRRQWRRPTRSGLAVIATTFTLVAVFLPTAFMGGIPGLIFRQFGVTAAVAVLASLLVARLLTPMMAAYFMKPSRHVEQDSGLMTRYLGWVKACLAHRRRTAAAAVVFLRAVAVADSAVADRLLPGFRRRTESGQPGARSGQHAGRDAAISRFDASRILKTIPEVRQVLVSVGTASTGGGPDASSTSDVRTATLLVELKARKERSRKQSKVEDAMRTALTGLPGARVSVGRGMNGEKLQVTLASDDPDALESAANAVETQLRTLKGVGNITSGASLQRPEVQIKPDYAKAAALGRQLRCSGLGGAHRDLWRLLVEHDQAEPAAAPDRRAGSHCSGPTRLARDDRSAARRGQPGQRRARFARRDFAGQRPLPGRPSGPDAQCDAVGRAVRPFAR